MVNDQIFDTELCGQPSCVECCAVMFLIGLEAVAVVIKAECLAQEPVGALDVCPVVLVERLVAEASHPLPVGGQGCEPILFLFGREDVEALDVHLGGAESVAVGHLMHQDSVADAGIEFGREHLLAHHIEEAQHLFVTVEMEQSFIFAFCLETDDLADDPDDAKDMIGVGVGDKHVVDIGKTNASILHLTENAVASTCVDQQVVAVVLEDETRVIAPGDEGVAGAEDDESVVHII